MFGTYRLLLALLVLLKHFKATEVFSGFAVWAFFVLSGFLITGVLNRRYERSAHGLTEFAVNRAMRLLPTYWCSVLAALAMLVWLDELVDSRAINSALAVPQTWWEWIPSVTILGGSVLGLGRLDHSLSPSAWAVEVEILMYICSAWWVARSERASRWTLIACVALFPCLWAGAKALMQSGQAELAGSLIYSFLPAALLPYALGSWLWHVRDQVPTPGPRFVALGLCALGVVACGTLVARLSVTAAFVLSLPLFGYLTLLLAPIKSGPASRRLDDFFGFMSYPAYLMHWIGSGVAVAITTALNQQSTFFVRSEAGMLETTAQGFAATVVATLAIAFVVAYALEAPIERRRHEASRALAAKLRGAARRDHAA